MPVNHSIRIAKPDDLAQIRQIDLECLGNTAVPMEQMKWLLEGQGNSPVFNIRVVHDEESATNLYGFICWKNKESEGSRYFEILSLSVGKNFRDESVEHSLVAKVIEEATELGCVAVTVNVPQNNISGVAFYLALGFNLQHSVKKYYDDGSDMDVLVKRIR